MLSLISTAKAESGPVVDEDSRYPRTRLPPISFPNADNFTFYSSTQNLPAVLNDPRKLKRQVDFFTVQWGEEFVPHAVPHLTLLPHIPIFHFNEYLKKTEFVSNPFTLLLQVISVIINVV